MSQVWNDNTYDASGHQITVDMQAIEDNFACLKSMFSGASAPSDPVAGMLWLDTTNHILKQRNETNNAWISIYNLSTGIIFLSLGSGVVAAAQLTTDAVETAKIKDGQVTAGKIYDGAITTTKIADANVTGRKLPNVTAATNVVPYSMPSLPAGTIAMYAPTFRAIGSTSYVEKKRFTMKRGGTYSIIFYMDIAERDPWGATVKVTKNGVSVEEHSTSVSSWHYNNVAVIADDYISLEAKLHPSSGGGAGIMWAMIACNDSLWGTVTTD
jgi:hypothetical protein